MALVTATEYKTYRGVSGSDHDTLLSTVIIPIAESRISDYCNVETFDSAAYTDEVHDGDGTQLLIVKNPPIDTGETVTVKALDAEGTESTIETNTYRAITDGRIMKVPKENRTLVVRSPFGGFRSDSLEAQNRWREGWGNILVSYTGGYATAPQNLKYAVYRMVDHIMAERGDDFFASASALGVDNVSKFGVIDQDAALVSLLVPYVTGSL